MNITWTAKNGQLTINLLDTSEEAGYSILSDSNLSLGGSKYYAVGNSSGGLFGTWYCENAWTNALELRENESGRRGRVLSYFGTAPANIFALIEWKEGEVEEFQYKVKDSRITFMLKTDRVFNYDYSISGATLSIFDEGRTKKYTKLGSN